MDCCYEVRHTNAKKGRGLFAKRLIKEGEEIFVEKPFVSVQFAWNESCKYLACHHCMKSLEKAQDMYRRLSQKPHFNLPHPELCEVQPENHYSCPSCKALFCSKECFEEALGIYHQILCTSGDPSHPLLSVVEAWKQMHYPPETFNVMLIVRLFAAIKQVKSDEDRVVLLEKVNTFCHATKNEEENIAHKLLGVQFQTQIEVLRAMLTEIVYDESLKECFTADGFRSLLALIGTNGQGIGTSSFSVWANNCDSIVDKKEHKRMTKVVDELYENINEASGPFLDCEGSGLYTLQSSCNHSCDPNSQVTFPYNNHVLCLKALKDIQPGEEIFISYLSECDQGRSRHSRQKLLRENYLFSCNCEMCASQISQPDVTSDEEEDDDDDDDDDCSMDED